MVAAAPVLGETAELGERAISLELMSHMPAVAVAEETTPQQELAEVAVAAMEVSRVI
jgi:hypothetical protein